MRHEFHALKRTMFAIGGLALLAAPVLAAPAYTLTKSTPLGAPDRWDYAVFDAKSDRVYVAHGDRLAVVDARSGEVVGNVEGIAGGTHGTGLSTRTGQGFTDDGRNGLAVAFDLKTLKVVERIATAKDSDAIATDAASGNVFVIEGDPGTISVISPKSDAVVATIKVGEGLEYAVGDDRGTLYVAGVEKSDLVRIDARAKTVTARWPTPDCLKPHGLAIDPVGRRLFMGCVNATMMVVDAVSGRVVTELPIGRGNDAVAWDPKRKRVFSSNGQDGTISVYQQTSPDTYAAMDTIATEVGGRTMAVDPSTGRLFVPAFESDPNPTPGGRPKPRAGSLRVMIFDPAQ